LEALNTSMGRLVAADLAGWLERRFFITTAGRAIIGSGQGHYFKDLFAEALVALNDQIARPEPLQLGVTSEEYAEALAYVAELKERERTRRGRSHYEKWAEWDAPSLDFGACVEFLTYSEGRDIVFKTENYPTIEFKAAEGGEVDIRTGDNLDSTSFEGTLAIPLPRSADPNNPETIIFPVLAGGTESRGRLLPLRADIFVRASYSSFDGVDFFSLKMEFDDGRSVTVSDAD
jgi:hypothetical protein